VDRPWVASIAVDDVR